MKKRLIMLIMIGVISLPCVMTAGIVEAENEIEMEEMVTEPEKEFGITIEEVEAFVGQTTETAEPAAESVQTDAVTDEITAGMESDTVQTELETSAPDTGQAESQAMELETEIPAETEDAAAGSECETETESGAEPVSESETETESESEFESDAADSGDPDDPTLHDIEEDSEVSEDIVGFTVDPSKYPAANVSENTKIIYQFLTEEMGFNHAAACGVLANIQMESGFSPLALGDSGSSYGICQWHSSRFNSLIAYCNANGYDYNTLTGQLAYLKYDLGTSFSFVKSYLLSVPDTAQGAYDAAYYWCVWFESPSETAARAQQRGNMALAEFYGLSFGSSEPEVVVEELEYIEDLEYVEDLDIVLAAE